MSRSDNHYSSLPGRLFVASMLLLVAAIAIRTAVHLLLSVVWPLVGFALAALTCVAVWRFSQRSSRW
jgi:Flp pilus assembly protein TadB